MSDQLNKLAATVAADLKIGDAVLLNGELGTGKTTFTKFLIKYLGGDFEEVTSPTFNLIHQYKTKNFEVWHFDLYRIKTQNELYNLGIEESLTYSVSIFEWGDIVKDLLYNDYTEIFFDYKKIPQVKKIVLKR
jgi:tRNA threonylcarbamoyladenosine biosynthesis protein TsaE